MAPALWIGARCFFVHARGVGSSVGWSHVQMDNPCARGGDSPRFKVPLERRPALNEPGDEDAIASTEACTSCGERGDGRQGDPKPP